MKTRIARSLLLSLACAASVVGVAGGAWAQAPQQPYPPGPPPYGAPYGGPYGQQRGMGPMRDLPPEQREMLREQRHQRREAWQQMSPEERHQLRRDIRDAGDALYPPRRMQRSGP